MFWLENMGNFAVANIRGGGEFGREWHNAGRGFQKQNSFSDFTQATNHVLRSGYTTPKQLVIHGASNGGLVVAVCANKDPDLYGCVIAQAPCKPLRYSDLLCLNVSVILYSTALFFTSLTQLNIF